MPRKLSGTASDELPQVLATGSTDVEMIFASLSAREQSGRDADYLQWHSLDHRPEQYRIAGLRHSMRLVSTPACRAARAFSDARYSAVDHVMTYFFAAAAAFDQFRALSEALVGERRPLRLPSVDSNYFRRRCDSVAAGARRLFAPRTRIGFACLVGRDRRRGGNLVASRGTFAGAWLFRCRRHAAELLLSRRGSGGGGRATTRAARTTLEERNGCSPAGCPVLHVSAV
jgi:hypothetical protein